MTSPKVLGYTLGPIPATAAFTSTFTMPADGPLQSMLDALELDRRGMDGQPGMYIKYVPARFDPLNRHLLTGGGYLFSTRDACARYVDWTTSIYQGGMPGVKFWERPIFQDVRRWTWDVVGAHNFAPPEHHALGRVQHFSYHHAGGSADVGEVLEEAYPGLRDAAREQGAAAFWLLHRPDEKLFSIHFVAAKAADSDPLTAGRAAVARVEALPSLVEEMRIDKIKTLDRTSLFIQNWLPVSRAAGGVAQDTPNFPILPQAAVE